MKVTVQNLLLWVNELLINNWITFNGNWTLKSCDIKKSTLKQAPYKIVRITQGFITSKLI